MVLAPIAVDVEESEAQWWKPFVDETLRDLIAQGLAKNLSLRSAWLDLQEQKASVALLQERLFRALFETSVQARFMIPMALSLGFGIVYATLIGLLLTPSIDFVAESAKARLQALAHRESV